MYWKGGGLNLDLSTIAIIGTASIVGIYLLWSYLVSMSFPVPHLSDEYFWEEEIEE